MDYAIQKNKTIVIKEKGCCKQLSIEQIAYILSNGYVCKFYFSDNDKTTSCSKLLKDLSCELAEYGFIRINHNVVVNPKYVESIRKSSHVIILVGNITLNVSRRKWYLVKDVFGL